MLSRHSASVAYYNEKLYLSFYEGPHEGWGQRVHVLRKDDDGWKQVWAFEFGTGNPVIFELNGRLFLAMSRFQPHKQGVKNCLDLWRNCDLEIWELADDGTEIHCPGPSRSVYRHSNLTPRCAPYVDEVNGFILPCYDEMFGVCYFVGYNRNNNLFYRVGCKLQDEDYEIIQPTVCRIGTPHNEMIALCRNFTAPYGDCKAKNYYLNCGSFIRRGCNYPNHNNSVLLIPNEEKQEDSLFASLPYVVYNVNPERKGLYFGKYEYSVLKQESVYETDLNLCEAMGTNHGSYPNYCKMEDKTVIVGTFYNQRGFKNYRIGLLTLDGMEVIETEMLDQEEYPYS